MDVDLLKERIDKQYGQQIFLDITIRGCGQLIVEFTSMRNDIRTIRHFMFEDMKVYANENSRAEFKCFNSKNKLEKTIQGKNNYFDIELTNLEFQHMDVDPHILFTVKKNPFSAADPKMIIKAGKVDDNGSWVEYVVFDGNINENERKIDITK